MKQHLFQAQPQQPNSALQSKAKRFRHRRIASGSGSLIFVHATNTNQNVHHQQSAGCSPVRDRRYRSDPDVTRAVQTVDTETQTDALSTQIATSSGAIHMDMSETDASPSPFVASRELSMCLRDSGRGRSIEDLNTTADGSLTAHIDGAGVEHVPRRASMRKGAQTLQRNTAQVHMRHHVAKNDSPSAAVRAVTPNGNSNELAFQDAGSSSDPDLLEDVMNSNERLDTRTPDTDDDNLERLGRRVSAFFTENRHSIQSAANSDNGNAPTVTKTLAAPEHMPDATQTTFADGIVRSSYASPATAKSDKTAVGGKVRRGFVSVSQDGTEVTVMRCDDVGVRRSSDDLCGNDSWTDEEGEDPDNQYLGLRRKR